MMVIRSPRDVVAKAKDRHRTQYFEIIGNRGSFHFKDGKPACVHNLIGRQHYTVTAPEPGAPGRARRVRMWAWTRRPT